ncbi:MAG: ATP-binding cassette domain-containing protein [Armatimonadetes bacterium]|nr:ATP-binding cassette domain-containing protein [Armatimonadota bacterium]
MIEVQGLTKYYGPHPAIMDVSFQVNAGEVVAFLGPNGAGKTTCMRILTGYMPATSGTAKIAGYDIHTESLEARRHIGYLPEHASLYRDMRVVQYLRYAGKLQGMTATQLRDRLDMVMERCGLTERSNQIIGTLSRGYRQRVGIAQALLHDPEVLILDEPTIGLDPNQIREMRSLIRSLAGDHTVMLSTHILPEAQMTCERVIIINQGRLVAEDTTAGLTSSTKGAELLMFRVAQDDSSIPRTLRETLSRVKAVRPITGDRGAYQVEAEVGSNLGPEVARVVVEKGWGLTELRPIEVTLEEAFHQLTTQEEGVN